MQIIKLPTGTFEYDPARPLGKPGGFGQVFSGLSPKGEEVAIKKLHLSAADGAHRELRIADELRGRPFQHIIAFIDSGEDADTGDYFVVMPRAEGSLQDKVSKCGPFAPGEAASILLQIAKGLIEVGVLVHRDLKPDNILFHEGKWKIADFGIARFVEEATASDTLRECLSPGYAAPEQWASERATHATDVYALGCIGFCLLTGGPPFTTNPRDEHLHASVPAFTCSNSVLKTIVNMALRKPPETRPQLSRFSQLLTQAVNAARDTSADQLSVIASAAAEVEVRQQKVQARMQEREARKKLRKELAISGAQILKENVERLWGKIHQVAPNADRVPRSNGMLQCRLGFAYLSIDIVDDSVEENAFRDSGWDVVSCAHAIVAQSSPKYEWSATLMYARKGTSEYRWHEVSFWTLSRHNRDEPYASSDWQEADLALSIVGHTVGVAFGPVEIDDEKEADFHHRWVWLLAQASLGKLRQPPTMPISGWPPSQ